MNCFKSNPNFVLNQIQNANLMQENDILKQKLQEANKYIKDLEEKYFALEEDFVHALQLDSNSSLYEKKIAYIGGKSQWLEDYQVISERFQTKLIFVEKNNIEAVCEAIETADEVICPADCPNQSLCHAARSSCTKFNKPIHEVEDSTPSIFQKKLSEIAIQLQ